VIGMIYSTWIAVTRFSKPLTGKYM